MPTRKRIREYFKTGHVTRPQIEKGQGDAQVKGLESSVDQRLALHKAVKRNDAEATHKLIDAGCHVDELDDCGWTPLVLASACGSRDAAVILLRKGADISARTQSGWTALHWASAYGCIEMVALLILKGADPTALTEDGKSPIDISRVYGKLEMTRYLDEYLDIIKLPIHRAVWERADAKELKLRLKNFPDGARQTDQKGNLPLHYAIETKAPLDVVVRLLEAYPEAARVRDHNSDVLLNRAIELSAPSAIIIAILASWPDAAKCPHSNGKLPLLNAIEMQSALDAVQAIAEAYPEGTQARDQTGRLPLHVALQSNQMFDTAQLLLKVNPMMARERDTNELLPLTRVLELHAPAELVEVVLKSFPEGASEKGKDGNTIHRALEARYPSELLLQFIAAYPAGVSETGKNGILPLHRAVDTQAPVVVIESLIKAFPRALTKRTKDGNLPSHIALEKPDPFTVMQVLLQANPSLAREKDRSGILPLAKALQRSEAQPDLLRLILKAFPKAASEKGRDGNLALHRCLELTLPSDLILDVLLAFPKAASIPDKFDILPLQRSIDNRLEGSVVRALIAEYPHGAWVRDANGQLPIQKAMGSSETESYVAILLPYTLPIDKVTGLPVPDPDHIWTEILQTSPPDKYLGAVEATLDMVSGFVDELANAIDKHGRKALDMATPKCKNAIQSHLHFYGRYELKPGAAEHQSATCIVRLAEDYMEKIPVALKFMRNKDQFLRELSVRTAGDLSEDFVIGVIRSHDGDVDEKFLAETRRKKGYDGYRYCLVMPAADRNLAAVLAHEHIAGKDWESIRTICRQITHALNYMHSKCLIHGDIKPLNIMRQAASIKLIDLDASAGFGPDNKQYAGAKFSSAYIPPELVHIPLVGDAAAVVKTVILDEQEKPVFDLMPYDPVPAAPAHDLWALGVVLFQMCCGETLFHANDEDNVDEETLQQLWEWSDSFKAKKLSKVSNQEARNLIAQLLSKDPARRPLADRVLAHPFLSGKKAARMVGEKAEFDVFLSYRVFSDSNHVEELYNRLTALNIRVWWDHKCLLPGEDWEDGFCNGLVKSRIFVCLLSRLAIQNFASLSPTSAVDNVLLEHTLALELEQTGLIEKVYPVLVGDLLADGRYSSYFKSGCHPKVADVKVESVAAKVAEHLERQGLGTPLNGDATAASVCKELMNHQGGFIQDNYAPAMDTVTQTIFTMVSRLRQQDRRNNSRPVSRPVTASGNRETSEYVVGDVTPRGGSGMRAAMSALESQNIEKEDHIAMLCKELESKEVLIDELRHHISLLTVSRNSDLDAINEINIIEEREVLERHTKSVIGEEHYLSESPDVTLNIEDSQETNVDAHNRYHEELRRLNTEVSALLQEKEQMSKEIKDLKSEIEHLRVTDGVDSVNDDAEPGGETGTKEAVSVDLRQIRKEMRLRRKLSC